MKYVTTGVHFLLLRNFTWENNRILLYLILRFKDLKGQLLIYCSMKNWTLKCGYSRMKELPLEITWF